MLSYIFLRPVIGSTSQGSQRKNQSKELDIYRSIDTLPAWNWYKLKETKDLGYLLKLNDYDTIPEFHTETLAQVYNKIATEIANYSDSNALVVYKEKTAELLNLRNKFNILSDCLIVLSLNEQNSDAEEIVKKYLPNFKNIAELKGNVIGLKKKIEMKYAEYKEKYQDSDEKELDIYEILDKIGQWRQTTIDPRNITVKQYLVMVKSFKTYINGRR
jgi:hypothetical protein